MHRARSLVTTALAAAGSLIGIRAGWEQPAYDVIDRVGEEVEIRRYGPRLVAETMVAATDEERGRNDAFRILAAYIFGENRASSEVAMTTPVAVEPVSREIAMTTPVEAASAGAGRWSMRFFLPSTLTPETAPVPTDARVRLREVPGETVAVLRFGGRGEPAVVAREETRLLAGLHGSRWRREGDPFALFYDPPWTPGFLRRNEVAVPVGP